MGSASGEWQVTRKIVFKSLRALPYVRKSSSICCYSPRGYGAVQYFINFMGL